MKLPSIVNDLASITQTSLAPAFLLAGTAGFVSVYAARLGRVSDRVNEIGEKDEQSDARRQQLDYLRRRTLALEIAVALGTLAAIRTGCAILNLLAGALEFGFREENLFWFFGDAIVSLIGSLVAFLFEMPTCCARCARISHCRRAPVLCLSGAFALTIEEPRVLTCHIIRTR